ncbi:hypothetical protein ACFWO5_13640 [Rhodococcus sp. NPDC058481]|uniref:hypothetical protein n=1 Tax=Rhodococcus sp. NPDC058481 TaxID=3346523 RepID=UPI00365A2A73
MCLLTRPNAAARGFVSLPLYASSEQGQTGRFDSLPSDIRGENFVRWGKLALRLAVAVGAIYAVVLVSKLGNPAADDVPDQQTLRSAMFPTTSAPATPTTQPPPLPPGFPSMQFPPPKIEVAEGQPQPIATKFGLTYDIPADWTNSARSVAGWSDDQGSVTYGAIGSFGDEYCSTKRANSLAMSGATGRNGVDIETVAREEVRKAERIFADPQWNLPRVAYSEPVLFEVAGRPAMRMTASVTDIPRDDECDPPSARFDIVTTAGYATAEVMILMVEVHQGLSGAPDPQVADRIISTLRRS